MLFIRPCKDQSGREMAGLSCERRMEFPLQLELRWLSGKRFSNWRRIRYLGHGHTRSVYLYGDEVVLKLARLSRGEGLGDHGANLREVEVGRRCGALLPRMLMFGVARYFAPGLDVGFVGVHFLLMERLVELSHVVERSSVGQQHALLAKAAISIVNLASKGVRASDCKLENFGLRGDVVMFLDFGSFVICEGAISKGQVKVGFKRLVQSAAVHADESVARVLRKIWSDAVDWDHFTRLLVASARQHAEEGTVEALKGLLPRVGRSSTACGGVGRRVSPRTSPLCRIPSLPPRFQSSTAAGGIASFGWGTPELRQHWRHPDGRGGVDFKVACVVPRGLQGRPVPVSGLPVVFGFPGMCDVEFGKLDKWIAVAPEPFVLVTLLKPKKFWWFIGGGGGDAWKCGEFCGEMVELFGDFMASVARSDGIDALRVCLLGYSAGAYAVVELLAASPRVSFSGVAVAGAHGHGLHVEGEANVKFESFLSRLRGHSGARWIEMIHCREDRVCCWANALQMFGAMDEGQRRLGYASVLLRLLEIDQLDTPVNKWSNRNRHQYFYAAFVDNGFLQRLFCDAS